MTPAASGRVRGREEGFTLLELLVVLVLVGLVVGLTLPAGARLLAAARERAWQDDLRAQLKAQPMRAFLEGRSLALDVSALRALVPEIPAEVGIELSKPLVYGPTGASRAAELRIKRPGAPTVVWRVAPVTGEVEG